MRRGFILLGVLVAAGLASAAADVWTDNFDGPRLVKE
jgi:hypothetical protein